MDNSKEKVPVYKKWWFWVIIVVVGVGVAMMIKPSSSENSETAKSSIEKVMVTDFSTMTSDAIQQWCSENGLTCKTDNKYSSTVAAGGYIEQTVAANTETDKGSTITIYYSLGPEPTTEQANALKKAQSYSDTMHMSKTKLYQQLTSEYGEGFPADAAQYAIDHVQADWNKNALEKAKSYYTTMNMSKDKVYEQLTSEYGEAFTPEQAQYAIDNLE